MPRKWLVILLLCAAAAAASIEASIVTRPGIGISPDSIVYMITARNVAAGHGITTPAANGRDMPLTHFPPGYPLVLAFILYFFKPTIFLAAKWLNIALFGVNTALIAGWVYRRTGGLFLTLFSALISISALDLLRVYGMAWSEPLFLFLTLGELLLLDFYLDRPSFPLLLSAALLSAAAVLTRYAGIAGVGAGITILFLCQKKPAIQKLKESAIFAIIAGLPIALWLLRNMLLTHDATTRKFVFHPVLQQIGNAAQSALSLWLFQGQLPIFWALPVGIAWVVFLGILGTRYKKKPFLSPHLLLLVIYSFSYILLIVTIAFFFEAQLLVPDEYDRILCPLHIAFLLTALTGLSRCDWPRLARIFFPIAALAMASWFVVAGAEDIQALSQDGEQFASADWRGSPTIAYVRRLPTGMHVYTNGRTPIYLYTNRPCFEIPPKILMSTLEPNTEYQKFMKQIVLEVRQGIAVVVDFTIEDLPQFPTPSEWETLLHKAPLKTADGTIFAS